MSKHTCSLTFLKGFFPEASSSWVISALRLEPFIWQSLMDIEFTSKAIEFFGSEPKNWSPASLALLSLGLPTRTHNLHNTSLASLDKELRKQVSKHFEDLTKGQPLYELNTDEDNIQPQWFSQTGLPQVGLTALALRERLQLVGTWAGLQEDLESLPNFSVSSWFAPLSVLYGLIPDPTSLLLELTNPASSYEMNALAMHAIITNPTCVEERWNLLTTVFSNAPSQIQSNLLNFLIYKHPGLGKEIAGWLSEQPVKHPLDLLENPRMDLLSQLAVFTHQAELFRSAGSFGQSMRLIDSALKVSANLQEEYTFRWYTLAEQASIDPESEDVNHSLNSLIDENFISLLLENDFTNLDLSPAEMAMIKIRIRSGDQNLINYFLPKLIENGTEKTIRVIPDEIKLVLSQALINSGDVRTAKQIVSGIQTFTQDDGLNTGISKWIENLYGIDSPTRLERLENLAHLHYQLGNHNEAVVFLHRVLKERPNHHQFLDLLGKIYYLTGQLEEAVHVFELVTLLDPENRIARREYAKCLELNLDYEDAFLEWSQILEKSLKLESTDNPPISDMLGVASSGILAGHPELAIDFCQKILALDVSNWRAHILLGKAFTAVEKSDEGLASLQIAMELAPDQAEPWLETAKIYTALGQPQQAMNVLQTAIQAVPNSSEIQLELGAAYLGENALTSAVVHLRKSYEQALSNQSNVSNPDNFSIMINASEYLGEALRRLGQLNESCQVLENAVKSIPHISSKNKSLLYVYAQSLLASGETSEAVPVLEQVISFEPDFLQPYLDYGRALISLGIKANAAVDALTYVYKADPKNSEALALLADALAADNKHTQAMEAYLEVMDTNITQEIKWQERLNLGLGRTALALQQVETAIAALQEAANLNPRNPIIYRWLADACWAAELPMDAWEAAKKTIQIDGNNLEFLAWFADHTISLFGIPKMHNLGFSRKNPSGEELQDSRSYNVDSEGILSFALISYQKAYSVIKDSPEMLIRMGHLQAVAGKNSSAVETLRIAVDHEKASIDVLRQSASILLSLNDYQTTIRSLEKGLSYPISDPLIRASLHKDLIRALLASDDKSEVEEYLSTAIKDSPNDISLLQTLSLLQISENQLDRALKTLLTTEEKCSNDGEFAELNYLQAWIYNHKGKLETALDHALTSLQAIRKVPNNRTMKMDQFDVISLAAQLGRIILEPGKVRGILSSLPGEFDFTKSRPANISNLLECYLSAAELALEIGDGAWAISAMGNIKNIISHDSRHMHIEHIRYSSLQAQINLLQGNETAALDNFSACRQALEVQAGNHQDGHRKQIIYPAWEHPLSKSLSQDYYEINYWDYLSVINISLGLYRYEEALLLSEHIASTWKNVPLMVMTHARVLTLISEQKNVCSEVNVLRNAPKINMICNEPGKAFVASIEATSAALANISKKTDFQSIKDVSTEITNPFYLRWYIRGNEVFSEKTFSWDSKEWSQFPMDAEDTAARLASLRRWIEVNPNPPSNSEIIQREVKRSEAFRLNFDVMFQLILLLEHENIEEALLLAHNFVIQSASFKDHTQKALFYALLAQISYRAGETETAYETLQIALDIWSDEPGWNLFAVELLMQNPEILSEGSNHAILNHLEKAIRQGPRMPQIYEIIWRLLDTENSTQTILNQEGIVLLENAASEFPDQPEILLALAKAYFVSGKISDQKQVSHYSKQVVSLKNSTKDQVNEATLLLAEMELQKKDAQEAFKLAGNVRTINPESEHAIMVQIQALELLGQHTQALNELENIHALVDGSKKLALKYTRLLGVCKSKEVELSALEELARKNPDDLNVLWALAQSLTETGHTNRAIQAAQNALLNAPQNCERKYLAGLHHLLGSLLSQLGQLDQAIHHLSKSIDYQPDYMEPYLILGEVYQKQRLHVKARKSYQQAIKIAPLDPRPYLQAAILLKEGKDYQNAETMLRRAVELSPHDVGIRKQLAAVVAINLVNNPGSIQSHSI